LRQLGATLRSENIVQLIKAVWADTDGIILPYVTVMLVVIIGVSVLALDGARFMYLQTQLQNGADALALAAAAELDRTPTAIERALNATRKFGSEFNANVKVGEVKFLSSLPVRDSEPILPAHRTSDPTRAAFVEITVEPVSMQTILPASIFGGSNVLMAGAQAVAGFDQVVCSFTPIYICNPFETPGMSYAQATQALVNANDDPAGQHKLIRLAGTQTTIRNFGPGNFGYLAPTTGTLPVEACGPPTGAGIGQAIAASRPPICLKLSGVDIQRANDQVAMDGLNTRFDIYSNGFQTCKDNYVADVNVRKGYVTPGNANWCNAKPSGTNWPIPDALAAALPVDQNMILVNADNGPPQLDTTVTLGNGTWDCAGYWSVAHSKGPGKNFPPPGCTNTATISRYSVYQYEMNYIADRSPGAEIGDPQCNPLGIKYRRVLNAAIINCGSNPEVMSNGARDVPVAAFGKFFLTVPAASGPSLYAEFLGLIKPTDAVNHDMVQLYR
jgi:Putative Flp pilus-assembly TadE/G-like